MKEKSFETHKIRPEGMPSKTLFCWKNNFECVFSFCDKEQRNKSA
jgi:hypothetical protein